MPKIKTNKAAAKRFRLTGKGNIRRGKAHKSHLLSKKSRNRKRKLRAKSMVHESNALQVKRMLGAA